MFGVPTIRPVSEQRRHERPRVQSSIFAMVVLFAWIPHYRLVSIRGASAIRSVSIEGVYYHFQGSRSQRRRGQRERNIGN